MDIFFNYGQYGPDRIMLAVHRKLPVGSECIWKTTMRWPEGVPMDVMCQKLAEKAHKAGYFEKPI